MMNFEIYKTLTISTTHSVAIIASTSTREAIAAKSTETAATRAEAHGIVASANVFMAIGFRFPSLRADGIYIGQ